MRILHKIIYGSHLYGTNIETSDRDYKYIFLPTAEEILTGEYSHTNETGTTNKSGKNTANDIDTEGKSLKEYLSLLQQNQAIGLEMIFAPESSYCQDPDPIFLKLKDNKDKFLNQNISPLLGYIKAQVNTYSNRGENYEKVSKFLKLLETFHEKHPLTTRMSVFEDTLKDFHETHSIGEFVTVETSKGKEVFFSLANKKFCFTDPLEKPIKVYKNILKDYGARTQEAALHQGMDTKAISHAYRLCTQTKEYITTGHITLPRPDADYIKAIRKGQVPLKEITPLFETIYEDTKNCLVKSPLREKPDIDFGKKFLIESHLSEIKKTYSLEEK